MIKDNGDRILLSVIIPINKIRRDYENLESIIQAVNGLLIEIIFVLDTSEDFAHDMLDRLCQAYSLNQYKILENSKRNPGSSKNIGIQNALGEWILFCDSDDYPNLIIVSKYLQQVTNDIDIVIGEYEVEKSQIGKIITLDRKKSGLNWESISITPGLWRWLIRREFLADIVFPELSMGEDQCFIVRLLVKEPNVEFAFEIFYRYRTGVVGSLTGSRKYINDLEKVINLEMLCSTLSRENLRIRNQIVVKQILTLVLRGNFNLKIKGLTHFIRLMTRQSPMEQVNVIRFILLILIYRRIF